MLNPWTPKVKLTVSLFSRLIKDRALQKYGGGDWA